MIFPWFPNRFWGFFPISLLITVIFLGLSTRKSWREAQSRRSQWIRAMLDLNFYGGKQQSTGSSSLRDSNHLVHILGCNVQLYMTNIIPAYHQPDQDCPSPSLQKSRYPGTTDAQYVQRTNGGFLPTRYIQDQDSCQGGVRVFTADFICCGPAASVPSWAQRNLVTILPVNTFCNRLRTQKSCT